jgi:hypothetical protein
MKIAAATTFSLEGYNKYAHRLIETFSQYWDNDIDLYVYYDTIPLNGWTVKKDNIHYLPANFKNLLKFKQKHENNPKFSKSNFTLDAVRFSHKVYAYVDLALNKNVDIAIWLDGDVITHRSINASVVLSWLNGKMAGALFRPNIYTETGFHIFDMRYPQAKEFMLKWIDYYNSDKILDLRAFTDCHTYDATVKEYDINLWNNLSPSILVPHPFINGILGEHMDHTKGPRKNKGSSHKSDLAVTRTEEYWKKI